MLNLRIKLGGDVYIGDNIRIVVKDINTENKEVELQFYAPRDIKILRGNLYRQRDRRPVEGRQAEQ